MFKLKVDKFLIASILSFSVLFLPFLDSLPYLDGNIDFVRSYDFYSGGFDKYFKSWNSVHPPLKLFLTNVFFNIGGLNPYSYNVIGFIFGIVGIIAIFYLGQELLNKQIARTSAMLLATSPLFWATGIFSLTDYLVTVLILVSLYYYAKSKYLAYAITSSLAVMAKETALILPVSVVVVELFYLIKRLINKGSFYEKSKNYLFLFPFGIIFLWFMFLKVGGQKPWSDWIFAETADKGAIYTVIYNIVSFNFLNIYAYQHWLQLFILNFNWFYWSITLIGFSIFILDGKNRRLINKEFSLGNSKTKTIFIIGLFVISYFLTVLTLQTYTIPRYALPLIPFLLMATSLGLQTITQKAPILKKGSVILLGSMIFSSLFFSLDPLSIKLWGKINVLGENIYGLNQHLAGNDGIAYNIQYLLIVKKRTRQILSVNNKEGAVVSDECHWVFPDPRNDYKTIKILQLRNLNQNSPCQSQK